MYVCMVSTIRSLEMAHNTHTVHCIEAYVHMVCVCVEEEVRQRRPAGKEETPRSLLPGEGQDGDEGKRVTMIGGSSDEEEEVKGAGRPPSMGDELNAELDSQGDQLKLISKEKKKKRSPPKK